MIASFIRWELHVESNLRLIASLIMIASFIRWELHVESNLRAAFEATADPALADFFVLPACLNRHWAHGWSWNAKRHKLRSCLR